MTGEKQGRFGTENLPQCSASSANEGKKKGGISGSKLHRCPKVKASPYNENHGNSGERLQHLEYWLVANTLAQKSVSVNVNGEDGIKAPGSNKFDWKRGSGAKGRRDLGTGLRHDSSTT